MSKVLDLMCLSHTKSRVGRAERPFASGVVALLLAATLVLAAAPRLRAQTNLPPAKEYIYLGGRVIAVENGIAITPAQAGIAAAGGSGTFSVSTGPTTPWSAQVTSGSEWLSLTPSSGTGNATVTYTAAANLGDARTGTLTIGRRTFTLNQGGAQGGWSNGYSYRRAIVIDHTKVPNTDQTGFPVLISGTYSYLAAVASGGKVTNANGYDIAFYADAAGYTPLSWEIENYSATDGAVVFWVKAPAVSHTADTTIYMFYGKAGIGTFQSTATGVWDSNFKGVWHLGGGSSLSTSDSTSNGSDGTAVGTVSAATGKISGAAGFSGSGNITIPDAEGLRTTSAFTVELWVYAPSEQSPWPYIIDKWDYSAGEYRSWSLDAPGWYCWRTSRSGADATTESAYALIVPGDYSTWVHLAGVYDGSYLRLYKNGVQVASTPQASTISTSRPIYIGGGNSGTDLRFIGSLDEVRFSAVARSSDWILAGYANQDSPGTFYAVGTEETGGI